MEEILLPTSSVAWLGRATHDDDDEAYVILILLCSRGGACQIRNSLLPTRHRQTGQMFIHSATLGVGWISLPSSQYHSFSLPREFYITMVKWATSSQLAVRWLTRQQNMSILSLCEAATGACTEVRDGPDGAEHIVPLSQYLV